MPGSAELILKLIFKNRRLLSFVETRARMIVCHCKRITDRQIRAAVRAGAVSRREVSRSCAAASRCGGCGPAVDAIIESERDTDAGLEAFAGLPELAATG